MNYPEALYRKAEAILSDRRQAAGAALAHRLERLARDYPDIWALRSEIAQRSVQLGAALISCADEEQEELIAAHRAFAGRLPDVLRAHGLAPDYAALRPHCPRCRDKGFAQGNSCVCRNTILNRLAYEMLSNISRVKDCGFDQFDLSYYTGEARSAMTGLLHACRRYAEEFGSQSPNLLFMGPTGLGKTHLSLSIAREVVNHGKLVLYASAEQLLSRLIDSKMGDAAQDEYCGIAYGCDLLIIDDLGTELQTKLTPSEVYSLMNTRINEARPTIINTNLSLDEMEKAYGQRVVSRIGGCYSAKRFEGKDIRLQKRLAATRLETTAERKCRVCGCTQNNACPGGCWWVEWDLCSRCAEG